jgi:hypothetical protein
MRRLLQFLSVGATLLLAGCAGQLATLSSGQIGCAPEDIVIENEEWSWGTRTWVARCGDRVYYCSSQGGERVTSGNVTLVSSPQVSCRRRGGRRPIGADLHPAAVLRVRARQPVQGRPALRGRPVRRSGAGEVPARATPGSRGAAAAADRAAARAGPAAGPGQRGSARLSSDPTTSR